MAFSTFLKFCIYIRDISDKLKAAIKLSGVLESCFSGSLNNVTLYVILLEFSLNFELIIYKVSENTQSISISQNELIA